MATHTIDLTDSPEPYKRTKTVTEDTRSHCNCHRSHVEKLSRSSPRLVQSSPKVDTIKSRLTNVETKLRNIETKIDRVMKYQEHPLVTAEVSAAQNKKLDGILDLVNTVFDSVTNIEDHQCKRDTSLIQ